MNIRSTPYNDTNTCENIKADGKRCEEKLIQRLTYKEKDKEGNWTGKWFCNKCYGKIQYRKDEATICGSRTGYLNQNCSTAKGNKFQKLTCEWKNVKDLNVENDDYTSPLDHSRDSVTGNIYQTKGKLYDPINMWWATNFKNEHNAIRRGFKFDYVIIYCANAKGDFIERIYEIPFDEILIRKGITIYKNPFGYRGMGWYEQYRITDEEIIKKVNEIWKDIGARE